MIARDLVVIGYTGSRAFYLDPGRYGGRPRHFPFDQNWRFTRTFISVPDILGFGQIGVDAPDGLIQPFAQGADVKVHDLVIAGPRSRGYGRPSRRREGGKYANHGAPGPRVP